MVPLVDGAVAKLRTDHPKAASFGARRGSKGGVDFGKIDPPKKFATSF